MSSEQKESTEKLVRLLSSQDININELSERAKYNHISENERKYLGLILGYLNKIFGTQTTFKREAELVEFTTAFNTKSDNYEKNISADALKEKIQPWFNSLIGKKSHAEKNALMQKIEVISTLIGDNYTEANLAFLWQCIHASEDPKKIKSRELLMKYQQHLKNKIVVAYPYEGGISIKDDYLSLMTRNQRPIEPTALPPNLCLLVEKYNAITTAVNVLNNPHSSIANFREHLNKKTRPIIEKERTPTDSAFLNAFIKLFTNPMSFFFKTAATQGAKVAKKIEKVAMAPNYKI